MKKKYFASVIILLAFAYSCSNNNSTIKRSTIAMGTVMEIQIRGSEEKSANQAIELAFREFKRLDTLFSTYLIGNEMWRINNSNSDTIKVDDEIFYLLKRCDEFHRITYGAFDPAVGNLIDLIGFDKGSPHLPNSQKIKDALEKTGWKKIKLIEPNILVKPKEIELSFNACIPGYAADRAAQILNGKGINDFLINAGGEIFAKGKNWKIGIQHPRNNNELIHSISINNISVSTSGDYRQYFKKDGKRYSHIFNPITGMPANELESVTIIAKEAITSDALSTAVFVLGKNKGMDLVNKLNNVECLIVDTAGVVHLSYGFENFILR